MSTILPNQPPTALDPAVLEGLELISSDGEPLETGWHAKCFPLLINQIDQHMSPRTDYYVGGNNFIYYSVEQVRNRDFRGPDFYYVPGAERFPVRDYWAVWEENDRTPTVVIELMSPTTEDVDRGEKFRIYRDSLHVNEYFIYDRLTQELLGWRLRGRRYVPIVLDENGRLWSEQLQLALGTWHGEHLRDVDTWLRFYHANGQVVLTTAEAERTRAEAERTRAEAERTRADAAEAELAQLRALLQQQQAAKNNNPPTS